MAFTEAELTADAFLGGRLTICQPKTGYRAGVDPIFLAAAVPAKAGQAVLELGCGGGVASLALGARVRGLSLWGLEIQPAYADLARRNAAANAQAFDVIEGSLAEMPAPLKGRQFHHVIANPPYYLRDGVTPAADGGRDRGLREALPLSAWIEAGAKRLRPGGRLTVIQRADRLPDLVAALPGSLGSVVVLPLAPRVGRSASLVILAAMKGGRAAFRLMAPVVLHQGDRHERDGDDYAPEARAVLRDGAAWPHISP